ncbi:MAG: hypothetical protein J5972_01815 [Eubacterium sp.]|nr:hypothetical protein [Eubacterium sp.]
MSDERYIGNESPAGGEICSLFVTVQSQADLSKKSDECLRSRALFCINLFGGYVSPRKQTFANRGLSKCDGCFFQRLIKLYGKRNEIVHENSISEISMPALRVYSDQLEVLLKGIATALKGKGVKVCDNGLILTNE